MGKTLLTALEQANRHVHYNITTDLEQHAFRSVWRVQPVLSYNVATKHVYDDEVLTQKVEQNASELAVFAATSPMDTVSHDDYGRKRARERKTIVAELTTQFLGALTTELLRYHLGLAVRTLD